MNLNRLFACLSGLAAWLLAGFAYAEYVYFLGFPDGYVTELGATERRLAIVFIAVSVPVGAYLLFLGWNATRRKLGGLLSVTAAFYLLLLLGVMVIDAYYQAHLTGGGGG